MGVEDIENESLMEPYEIGKKYNAVFVKRKKILTLEYEKGEK